MVLWRLSIRARRRGDPMRRSDRLVTRRGDLPVPPFSWAKMMNAADPAPQALEFCCAGASAAELVYPYVRVGANFRAVKNCCRSCRAPAKVEKTRCAAWAHSAGHSANRGSACPLTGCGDDLRQSDGLGPARTSIATRARARRAACSSGRCDLLWLPAVFRYLST